MTCSTCSGGAYASVPSARRAKKLASLQAALLFAIVANPKTFEIVQGLVGGWVRIASRSGVPTMVGLTIHAIVYGLIAYCLM